MKSSNIFSTVVFCLSFIVAPLTFAEAPPAKPQPKAPAKPQAKPQAKAQGQPAGQAEVLKKYDLDKNRIINLSEAQAIQEAYEKNPQDPMLKKYDLDKNAKLSDGEVMKIVPPPPAPPKPKAKPKAKPAPPKKKKK
jgi:hypothetical protein